MYTTNHYPARNWQSQRTTERGSESHGDPKKNHISQRSRGNSAQLRRSLCVWVSGASIGMLPLLGNGDWTERVDDYGVITPMLKRTYW